MTPASQPAMAPISNKTSNDSKVTDFSPSAERPGPDRSTAERTTYRRIHGSTRAPRRGTPHASKRWKMRWRHADEDGDEEYQVSIGGGGLCGHCELRGC